MRAALLIAAALAACSRQEPREAPGDTAAPRPPDLAPAPTPAPAPPPGAGAIASSAEAPPISAPSQGEARRSTLARLDADPLLRPALAALREHFGADARGPFAVARVDLAGGRAAALVSRADESDPIVVVLDRDALAWSKPRPLAGIVGPAQHAAIAPRPDGGVAVFVWVAPLGTVAARMWADDSNPFGDFQLFPAPECDALSAAYAPRFGWVVACSSRQGTRVQRMRDDGTTAWGAGVTLGAASPVGPATILFDSPSTFVLVQRARAIGGDRAIAYRYDGDARALWPAALELGAAAGARERLGARVLPDGGVALAR
jgi:hypothetical protein